MSLEILTSQEKEPDGTQNYLKKKENEQESAKEEKQELETEMLRMAQGMKAFASGFKTQFQVDE